MSLALEIVRFMVHPSRNKLDYAIAVRFDYYGKAVEIPMSFFVNLRVRGLGLLSVMAVEDFDLAPTPTIGCDAAGLKCKQ